MGDPAPGGSVLAFLASVACFNVLDLIATLDCAVSMAVDFAAHQPCTAHFGAGTKEPTDSSVASNSAGLGTDVIEAVSLVVVALRAV
jgi:hypothetical protein